MIGSGRMAPRIAAACAGTGAHVLLAGRDVAKAVGGRAGVGFARAASRGCAARGGHVRGGGARDRGNRRGRGGEDRTLGARRGVAEARGDPRHEHVEPLDRRPRSRALAAGALRGTPLLNPAHLTGVVEVVPGSATVPATALALVDLVQRMGKTSLVLRRDIPGFLWNRLQFAVLRACLYPLDEGVADVASIDVAVSDGLAPRWLTGGPLATADLGGLDTFRRAAAQLFPALAGPAEAPRSLARRAEEERCFYGRTDEALAAVEALRAEAIEAGRGLAERRRTAMPEADA